MPQIFCLQFCSSHFFPQFVITVVANLALVSTYKRRRRQTRICIFYLLRPLESTSLAAAPPLCALRIRSHSSFEKFDHFFALAIRLRAFMLLSHQHAHGRTRRVFIVREE